MSLWLNIDISYPMAKINHYWPQVEITQPVAELEVEIEGPEVFIDQRAARHELGFGDYSDWAKQVTHQAKQMVLEGISNYAAQGDRMAREMTSQNTIQRIAREEMFDKIPEIQVDIAPKSSPKMEFNYSQKLYWDILPAEVSFNLRPPEINWQMGVVDISVLGNNFDVKG